MRLQHTPPAGPVNNSPPLPPTAPKPFPNIKSIRLNPELHAQNCANRNYPHLTQAPYRIAQLYEEWTSLQTSLRKERERHNSLSGRLRAVSPLKTTLVGDETREQLLAEAKELKAKITQVEARELALEDEMRELALQLPNTTHPEAPVGDVPKVLGYINDHLLPVAPALLVLSSKPFPGHRKSHLQIGQELQLLDFSAAATVSGWGWYFLMNEAVLLEQALINYALHLAVKLGWKLVAPPSIVYSHIGSACGFKPRDQNGEQQVYTLQQPTRHQGVKPELSLAGTAEIPLAAMYTNRIFSEDELPAKIVGVSRCYRAEAGARGVESKGLYRVHEFTKVEMFAWTLPNPAPATSESGDATAIQTITTEASPTPSEKMFSEMLHFQTTILTSLRLPARILSMPTADLGASASNKVDIEAYMPSRYATAVGPWGEVSSLSSCLDYQSRRLNARVRMKDAGSVKKSEFPYTLNGTAIAVPRVLLAILENGWDESLQGVVVPEVLKPWMGGVEVIKKH